MFGFFSTILWICVFNKKRTMLISAQIIIIIIVIIIMIIVIMIVIIIMIKRNEEISDWNENWKLKLMNFFCARTRKRHLASRKRDPKKCFCLFISKIRWTCSLLHSNIIMASMTTLNVFHNWTPWFWTKKGFGG